MSKLFEQIEQLVPTLPGWCEVDKAITLASMVLALRPAITVEIGVYGGRSILPMALAHKEIGFGTVIGIDPWSQTASIKDQRSEDAEWWGKINHEQIYQGYLKTADSLGLSNVLKTLRMTSDEAAPRLKGYEIQIMSCDGNHCEQAYRDAVNYAPLISVGGLWIADDISWHGGHVQRGLEHLKKNGFVPRYQLGTGAVFQRVR